MTYCLLNELLCWYKKHLALIFICSMLSVEFYSPKMISHYSENVILHNDFNGANIQCAAYLPPAVIEETDSSHDVVNPFYLFRRP